MNKGLVAFLAVGIVVCGAIAWSLFQRAGTLRSSVEVVEQRGAELSQTLQELNNLADGKLDEIEAAEALHREAQRKVAEESRQLEQAEQERASAEAARERALEAAGNAQAAREAAELSVAEQRRQRRDEWQRLGAALRKIAPTTSHEWSYAVSLGQLDIDDEQNVVRNSRELLSRLAGVLLANYGYSAVVAGSDASTVVAYLNEAGVPSAAIAVGSGTGEVLLTVDDTVLN